MTTRPEKGDNAPPVTLPVTGGGEVTLGAPAGKAQVVFFYPTDNTPGCTTESIAFSTLRSEFEALSVAVIGVSKDSMKSHDKFVEKKELTVPLASDEETDACEQYGVWVEKNMYGKKYMGIERSTFLIGHDGKILEVWRKVKVKAHAEAVLDATRAALA
jgi:peroxiredoxin Q/BCP